jgi:mannose-6-phosphate isomerase-like protein (cupin superfamily)
MRKLNDASAFSTKSPYEIYQEWEGIPVYKNFIVPDLLKLELGPWNRTGGKAAFVNMDGAGGTCDTIVEEIAPGGQLKPLRHMYEKAVFILQGQGATTIWNEGGRKHTLEWQRGSLFSTPLNAWHQHFNAQGSEPVRMISLTDGPVIINCYRNLDYIFNSSFVFTDRYSGGADEWGKGGRYLPEVKRGRVWESNFIADLWGFQPKDYKERGGDNRTTLFEFVDNTMSAHVSEFPAGKYKKAHRHGAGAHIVMLTGSGYSFL